MIAIINIGISNLRSIQYKLEKNGIQTTATSAIKDIEAADKLILPGVGHFKTGMENLKSYNLLDVLNYKIKNKKTPILGICLGMQLFTKKSEEGNIDGLGWIDAETKKFDFPDQQELKIPHVGWNTISIKKPCQFFKDVNTNERFYFTHSFYVKSRDTSHIAAETTYGHPFTSAVQQENIFGTQFHPEKSHMNGFKIITNFINY